MIVLQFICAVVALTNIISMFGNFMRGAEISGGKVWITSIAICFIVFTTTY